MGDRQEIQAIPGALRLTLEKAHAEYGAVARKIRWGDGPVYLQNEQPFVLGRDGRGPSNQRAFIRMCCGPRQVQRLSRAYSGNWIMGDS